MFNDVRRCTNILDTAVILFCASGVIYFPDVLKLGTFKLHIYLFLNSNHSYGYLTAIVLLIDWYNYDYYIQNCEWSNRLYQLV